uniref:Spexin hormone n=1 Tax=Mastacembelus armatus TaxID=205130 RepID=A0A3Q3N3I1_9TELE
NKYLKTVITLLVMTLVTQSWTAPQVSKSRRNWTPQAILYLKGARKSTFKTVKLNSFEISLTHDQCSDGPGLSLVSSILLDLLQQTVEKGKTPNVSHHQHII